MARKTRSGIGMPPHERAAKNEKAREAEGTKMTRLRALRLAKEAADRVAMLRPARPGSFIYQRLLTNPRSEPA
jgi:hypothetical protein